VIRPLALLVLSALPLAAAVEAQTPEPADTGSLDATVQALVADAWGVEPASVVLEWSDAKDDVVGSPADVELVGSGARGSFVVRIGDDGRGSAIRLRAGLSVPVLVASRHLPRGTVLSESDIQTTDDVAWGPPAVETSPAAPGWVTQRSLPRGARLEEPAVRPALSVTSGSPVEIVWRRGSISLALPGTAAGNGAIGEQVLVRSESGKRMRGLIIAAGVVDVTRGASISPEGGR